jgi:hypothetical protein
MPAISNRSGQLLDILLTNVGRKYTPAGFIADQVAPRVTVAKESGQYPVWTRADFHRTDTNPLVPDRSETKRVDFSTALESYVCEEYALATDVSRREVENAADVLQLRSTKVQGIQDLIALNREVRVATALRKTTTGKLNLGSTPSTNWDQDTATIESDLVTAKNAIYDAIGRMPNLTIIPVKVAEAMAQQADIREILKYTVNGQQILQDGEMVLPSSLWGLRVLIPTGQYTTSAEDNATQTFTEVWGDEVRVLYNGGVSLNSPSPLLTLQTRGFEVRSWRVDDPEVERIRVSDGVLVEKCVAPDAGYELADLLS